MRDHIIRLLSPGQVRRLLGARGARAVLLAAGGFSPGRVCHFKSDNPNPNALKDTCDCSCHYARS
jgi:hypothetical protein